MACGAGRRAGRQDTALPGCHVPSASSPLATHTLWPTVAKGRLEASLLSSWACPGTDPDPGSAEAAAGPCTREPEPGVQW